MKIGIISDSHDHIENLSLALEKIKRKCDVLIHCGDLCAPFVLFEFTGIETHFCFGNIDDRYRTTKIAIEQKINLHGEVGEIEKDGKKIAFTHLPKFAEGLALTGKYDVVFYGHTHISKIDKVGDCLLVNPGEIMGRKNKPSFAIYNTKNNKVEILEL